VSWHFGREVRRGGIFKRKKLKELQGAGKQRWRKRKISYHHDSTSRRRAEIQNKPDGKKKGAGRTHTHRIKGRKPIKLAFVQGELSPGKEGETARIRSGSGRKKKVGEVSCKEGKKRKYDEETQGREEDYLARKKRGKSHSTGK